MSKCFHCHRTAVPSWSLCVAHLRSALATPVNPTTPQPNSVEFDGIRTGASAGGVSDEQIIALWPQFKSVEPHRTIIDFLPFARAVLALANRADAAAPSEPVAPTHWMDDRGLVVTDDFLRNDPNSTSDYRAAYNIPGIMRRKQFVRLTPALAAPKAEPAASERLEKVLAFFDYIADEAMRDRGDFAPLRWLAKIEDLARGNVPNPEALQKARERFGLGTPAPKAAPAASEPSDVRVPLKPTRAMQDAWDGAPFSDDTDAEFHGAYAAMLAAAPQPAPTMADALAAGDGTLHGAIDHWQERALRAEAALKAEPAASEPVPAAWMNSSSLTLFAHDRERYPLGGGGDMATARYMRSDHHDTPLYRAAPKAEPGEAERLRGLLNRLTADKSFGCLKTYNQEDVLAVLAIKADKEPTP